MFGMQKSMGCRMAARMLLASVRGVSAGALALVLCIGPGAAVESDRDLGTWMNSENKGKIQLRECGEESLCGEIVWLRDAVDENGKPWRDMLNPDPSLRSREVVGLDVMIGTKKIGPATWQGQIYDPEVGKTYYLKHLKVGKDKVEIRGCLSAGWPCRTKYWTRTEPVQQDATPLVAQQQSAPPPAPRVAAAPPPAPRNVAPRPAPQPAPRVAAAPPPAPRNYAPPPAPRNYAPPPAPRNVAPPPAPTVRAPQPVQRRRPDVTAALPAPGANVSGGYLVQVAARQSHSEALAAFNDLQQKYPQMLGGLAPEVMRADLGQRGIWYRVGVGPMLQQQAAADFCNQLKSMGADCLIRRR